MPLQQSWTDVSGWYLFTEGVIPDSLVAAFAAAALASLPVTTTARAQPSTRGGNWHVAAWIPAAQIISPTALGQVKALLVRWTGAVWACASSTEFGWGGLGVNILQGAIVGLALSGEQPAVQVTLYQPSTPAYIALTYDGRNAVFGNPTPWLAWFPLSGSGAGSLHLPVALDLNALAQHFGCGFRFFGRPDASVALNYPLFPYTTPTGQPLLAFDVWLHPLFPLDAALTRLSFDLADRFSPTYSANARALVGRYFFNTEGAPLEIRPYDPGATDSPVAADDAAGGLAFSVGGMPDQMQLYLSPSGLFTLEPDGTPAPATFELMPGLFEREYLRLDTGDMLAFVPNQPAFAAGFGSAVPAPPHASPNALGLSGPLTTSWMRVLPMGLRGTRGFYSQPSAASYFGEVGEAFPGAMDAFMGDLADPAPAPVAPYGGIAVGKGAPSPDIFAEFEAQVLSATRHDALSTETNGPIMVIPASHARGLAIRETRLLPATAVTPQGLLVELSSDGQWSAIVLALAPEGQATPREQLRFDGVGTPPLAPAPLTSLLTRNELFLVISRLDPTWPFANTLVVGGFRFVLDVPTGTAIGSPEDGTILVFKYNTRVSLLDLAAQPSLWAGADTFNANAAAVSAALLAAIATARQEADAPGKPFSHFNALVEDPAWTGLLAFNALIDGAGMPLDLQMLLGGINGKLRAHHFGVQSNHLERRGTPPTTEITQSSLFGVIFYQGGDPASSPATPCDYDYEVETLSVVFENSAVTLFDVEIGMTVNTLFGRAVALDGASPTSPHGPPTNTLRIKGQYQDRGGVGTVTFVSQGRSRFAFMVTPETGPRVLEALIVRDASLAPVSHGPGPSPGSTAVAANFSMGGELWFTQAPFPNSGGLDLFSYGNPTGAGLGFSGLTIAMTFVLEPDGSMKPSSRQLSFRPDLMQPAPVSDAIRPSSLMYSLPLKFSRFTTSPTGLTAQKTGATPVHVLELETGPLTAAPHASPGVVAPGQSSPYATTAPLYALEYDISLGSLGSLSSVHGGLSAKLLLGWGPSPTVPDADAAAVMIQLPQLSAGYQGFNLQGLLKTTFGDANLLKLDLGQDRTVYALLLNNIQFSIFSFTFPPGVMTDFLLFAGTAGGDDGKPYSSNLAWYLAVTEAA